MRWSSTAAKGFSPRNRRGGQHEEQRATAVFDCNVLLRSLLYEGPAFRCLEPVECGEVELLVSFATLEEARDVFTRPEITGKYPQLATAHVSAFFSLLARKATLLENVPHVVDFPRDPKDEPYLDLAAAGHAEYLVTRDKDLFSLPQEQSPEAEAILRLCPNLRIMDPVAFLHELDVRQKPRSN